MVDGAESDDGPDSAVSAAAVPGLAATAKPTPTANMAEPTRVPKVAEFTLPPWLSNTPKSFMQHALNAGAQLTDVAAPPTNSHNDNRTITRNREPNKEKNNKIQHADVCWRFPP